MIAVQGRHLTLLLPGLFGPGMSADDIEEGKDPASEAKTLACGLELPHLVRVLSRARVSAAETADQSLEALYFRTFDLPLPTTGDLPVAALSAAADGLQVGTGVWLRADPVHLHPDLGRLILRDGRELNLQADEARQLAAELNAEIGEFNLQLQVTQPTRWYLQLQQQPRFTSVSPASAHGQDADACLLRGEDEGYWHQLQNHLQMLLHQSPVNETRENDGRTRVNSLWFWGAGSIPVTPARRWTTVYADEPVIEALAHYSDSPCQPLSASVGLEEIAPGDTLVAVCAAARSVQAQDRYAWQQALMEIDQSWLGPAYLALRERKLDSVTISCGGYCKFILDSRSTRKWWRRDQPLSSLFLHARQPRT